VESPGLEKLEVYDYPGGFAGRFDGPAVVPASHRHPGAAVYVGGTRGGTYIHGWPPCPLDACVLAIQEWDRLHAAIVGEAELTFSIEG
jgi:hypothetical protein